ncbi:hypothetical protein GCM10010106_03200 [Thermopolyspora flexuosa]|uniref:Uncharacterized protein DUF3592 n=1 Tax=Thermopolyspora flexuosa TaxID=103836 RepID=A0A543IYG5_9ACTN|nr:DUF3592 domain-containing protein [Thermopolyspora flexuosa]TQM75613.1 uncharacterized protein DUF3592 [Thermopolyspora flexuosa]GGM60727.1 hypothetical protein GCM10010106_03200 [Thermopolyspora flexuosa]
MVPEPYQTALIFGLSGLACVIAGTWIVVNARRFRRRAVRVPGRIVELSSFSGGGSSTLYRPVVAFTTLDGTPVEAKSVFASFPPVGFVGEAVYVLYDPADPGKVRVDRLSGRGGLHGVLFAAFGLIFVAVGVLIAVLGG